MAFLIFIIVTALYLALCWSRRKAYAFTAKLPGPLGFPMIGAAYAFQKRNNVFHMLDRYFQKYGSLYTFWIGPMPFLTTSEPQLIQDILTSPDCVNKGTLYKVLEQGLGYGLMSISDPDWSRHRKCLNSAFSRKVLQSLMPIFNIQTDTLVKEFHCKCKQGGQNLFKILERFTLALSTQTTTGVDLDSEVGSNKSQLIDSYECVPKAAVQRMFAPWLSLPVFRLLLNEQRETDRSINKIKEFAKKLVQRNLEANKDEKSFESNIFINVACDLIRSGHLTNEEVEDETNTIIFGAFETTANTISYIIMCLAMFPAIQQKLFEEIRSFFPEREDFQVTIADTQQLVYMDMVINETMRLFAPVPYVMRKPTKDIKLSNGLVLPNDIEIIMDIFHLHRRKDIWGPDADTFNPDNFLPSNLENKHPYAFIPFTKGIRQCIGWRYGILSVKVILAKLVRNFHFTTEFKFKDLSFLEEITLKLQEAPLIIINQRDN